MIKKENIQICNLGKNCVNHEKQMAMKEANKEKETEANERVKGKKREKESTVFRTVAASPW